MADELTLGVSLRYSKNGLTISQNPASFNVTVSGNAVASGTQSVTTSAANLEKGDITTSGYLLIQNLDGTNFVQVGFRGAVTSPASLLYADG